MGEKAMKTCPYCGVRLTSQGMGGHIFIMHGMKVERETRYVSDPRRTGTAKAGTAVVIRPVVEVKVSKDGQEEIPRLDDFFSTRRYKLGQAKECGECGGFCYLHSPSVGKKLRHHLRKCYGIDTAEAKLMTERYG